MGQDPRTKRAMAFIDASNTRAAARRAFGEAFGNFNPVALAEHVCQAQGWVLAGVSLYLGVPDVRIAEDGHYTWIKRCARWRRQGVHVFTRTLLHDERGVAREKGIDIRLALDAVSRFRAEAYDVALIFSQDQDFAELATELRAIARDEKRWIHIVSVFPAAPRRDPSHDSDHHVQGESDIEPPKWYGIAGTTPIAMDEEDFRNVLDTPENRRRVHTPLSAPLARHGTRDEIRRAALAPATERRPRSSTRRMGTPRGWAGRFILTYLAAVVLTFGYLTWTTRAELATSDDRLTSLANHARTAFVWPAYWLAPAKVEMLNSRLLRLKKRSFGF